METDDTDGKKKPVKPRRRKGTGGLFRRGDIWYAKWTDRGEATVVSTGIRADGADDKERRRRRREAEDWLMEQTEPLRLRHRADAVAMLMRRLQTAEERLKDAVGKTVEKATLGDMARLFRESARRPDCSEGQLSRYCAALDRFAAFAGAGKPVADVGDSDAEAYSRHLAKSFSPNTHNKNVNALDLAWRVCGASAGIANGKNPWAAITRKRLDTHVRRVLTHEETDKMLATAKGELRTLVAVCLYTGLRLGDACRLKWEDVRDGAVFVLTAKRGRRVAVPIHPKLAEVLAEVRGRRRGYVMPNMARRYGANENGSSAVSKHVTRLIVRCGIEPSFAVGNRKDVKGGKQRMRPDAGAHSLRHTFVTRAIEAGVPPHVVQAVVGHSSAAMTEHYTHLSDKAVLEAFGKIE